LRLPTTAVTLNLKREAMHSKIHDFYLAGQRLTQRRGKRKNTPIILTQFLMTVLIIATNRKQLTGRSLDKHDCHA
jgi:hypothetical protein